MYALYESTPRVYYMSPCTLRVYILNGSDLMPTRAAQQAHRYKYKGITGTGMILASILNLKKRIDKLRRFQIGDEANTELG